MKNKPFIFCTVIYLLKGASLNAQNTAPDWYLNKYIQYPDHLFISAIGEGRTREDAEAEALAYISMFFRTNVEVRNQLIRQYNEVLANSISLFNRGTYLNENAVIRSDVEFFGIRFAAPWYNSNTNTWVALAYINREEASEIYEARISVNMDIINTLLQEVEIESEWFYAAALLNKAVSIGNITEELARSAVLINPDTREKYASIYVQIGNLRAKFRTVKENCSFGLQTARLDNSNRIENTLCELLEQQGYIITQKNPVYNVNTILSMNEEKGTEYFFVRPGLIINIEREGKTFFSYSKNYPRVSHLTLAGAYNRGILAVERDLKENFITELTAGIGR